MARTVLAMATSHSPGLNGPVERWFTRAEPDRRIVEANGLGDYEQLAREKASWIGAEITEEKLRERYAACQQAIAEIAVQGIEDGGKIAFEFNIDDGADNLGDLAE